MADAALLGAGMMCMSGAAMFYRQKKTTAFKVRVWWANCGVLAWSPQVIAHTRFATCRLPTF